MRGVFENANWRNIKKILSEKETQNGRMGNIDFGFIG
jgi:hypothetical protein